MNEQIRHIETLHIYIICLREHLNPIGTRVVSRARPKELTQPKPHVAVMGIFFRCEADRS